MQKLLLLFCLSWVFLSCNKTQIKNCKVYYNATFHTMDSSLQKAEYIEVTNGLITASGNWKDYPNKEKVEQINLHGNHVYPGFIDAHCHFYHYGLGLNELNLKDCKSFNEVVNKVIDHSKDFPDGWLQGRGWDETLWDIKGYPTKAIFDSLFPDRPILIKRIDGHAALANNAALVKAGINSTTKISGGEILLDNNGLTGILIDNAVDAVFNVIPAPSTKQKIHGILKAQENCLKAGLTTVVCAGLDVEEILFMDSLQKTGNLTLNIYAMLNPKKKNFDWAIKQNGKPYKTNKMHIRSFKLYADGSLGSRGALLKEPYCDKQNHFGLPVLTYKQLDSYIDMVNEAAFQVNTHSIGDSANSMMLNLYGKYLKNKNNKRWRIEHAQVVDTADLKLFTKYSILPSVQPTHATSDMRWAEQRLCSKRMAGAYAYKKLLHTNGILPLGTDFPVENIYPLETYFAAVFREKNGSDKFQIEDALSPTEALMGMTQWAAYSIFEENDKGSLEIGKKADFIVINKDITSVPIEEFKTIEVLQTYLNGEKD